MSRGPLATAPVVDILPDTATVYVLAKASQIRDAQAVAEQRRHPSGWVSYLVGGRGVYDVVLHLLPDGWTGRCTCASARRDVMCSHLLAAAQYEEATQATPIPPKTRTEPDWPALTPEEVEGFYD